MFSALPIRSALTQINYPGIYVSDDPSFNKMVERESFLRSVLKLRETEESPLQESVREVCGEAKGEDEEPEKKDFQCPIIGSEKNYPNQIIPDFVTTCKNPVKSPPNSLELSTRPITNRLQDKILGKAPLRLVVARSPYFIPPSTRPAYFLETLECSHVVEAFPSFKWDDGGHLIYLPISAKRRRCQPCKALEQAKKPVQSVREIPDERAGEL